MKLHDERIPTRRAVVVGRKCVLVIGVSGSSTEDFTPSLAQTRQLLSLWDNV